MSCLKDEPPLGVSKIENEFPTLEFVVMTEAKSPKF